MNKTLVVCSGGLDSVTLAHHIAHQSTQQQAQKQAQELMGLLTFNYGQRHRKEIDCAIACAQRLNVPHHLIDISTLGQSLQSALTSHDEAIPEGHYAADNMASTVVPNRNAIMLTIAFGFADSIGATQVAIAVHGGDHFIYPDCRPEFIEAFATMQQYALGKTPAITLFAPYLTINKGDIAAIAGELSVPIHETWSCYNGGDIHCGRCGTCVERLEAVHHAGITDQTTYADTTFWHQATQKTNP